MRILIVTPAPPGIPTGNRWTATRWARLLRDLGHRVLVASQYDAQPCDLLVALHARKSAPSMERFWRDHPDGPVILALTGTDLYYDLKRSQAARHCMERAWRLVLLQMQSLSHLPEHLAHKTRVIYQSAEPLKHPPRPSRRFFDVAVVGHLRPVKDPFRAALAVRRMPADSRVRVLHLGEALSDDMRQRAEAEMRRNPRYRWLGLVSRGRARQIMARSRLLVLTSRSEGGPAVLSDALAFDLPIISSRIAGTIGLLGEDYPGYFEVGNTAQLADLILRAERDSAFYERLREACRRRTLLVDPQRERESWNELLGESFWESCTDGRSS